MRRTHVDVVFDIGAAKIHRLDVALRVAVSCIKTSVERGKHRHLAKTRAGGGGSDAAAAAAVTSDDGGGYPPRY